MITQVSRWEAIVTIEDVRGALGFFPWVTISDPVELGGLRLVPWYREGEGRSWLLRVLRPYEHVAGEPILSATLVHAADEPHQGWDAEAISRFFMIRDLVSFCGIAKRRFFDQAAPHINDHLFQGVVQSFDAAKGGGTFKTLRRRDGTNGVYVTEEAHHVVVPEHVTITSGLELDERLLTGLTNGWMDNNSSEWLMDAVALFNLANTDATDAREQTELLLSVAAVQAVLGSSGSSRELELGAEFEALMGSVYDSPMPAEGTPRASIGGSAPSGVTLRQLWFRDLYRTRGALAHGQTTTRYQMRWSVFEHLLLASHIVPQLVKAKLSSEGHYDMSDQDIDHIVGFDSLLAMENCLSHDTPYPGSKSFHWPNVLASATRDRINREAGSKLRFNSN